ncbi:MAG: hypothetical protein KGI50_03300 [Patescibacteria group bacterium]|nr:hypothetical protein [Patescibacteria group bacterium]MDE2438317.1 hypothetical protein [Patescibacteria group bacterium]
MKRVRNVWAHKAVQCGVIIVLSVVIVQCICGMRGISVKAIYDLYAPWRYVPVRTIAVGNLTVYVEREGGVQILHEEGLPRVIVRAYYDFPTYCAHYYPNLYLIPQWNASLYQWRNMRTSVMLRVTSEAMMADSGNGLETPEDLYSPPGHIWVKARKRVFDVSSLGNENTIRHELFHHFWHTYALDASVNEWNAYQFGTDIFFPKNKRIRR